MRTNRRIEERVCDNVCTHCAILEVCQQWYRKCCISTICLSHQTHFFLTRSISLFGFYVVTTRLYLKCSHTNCIQNQSNTFLKLNKSCVDKIFSIQWKKFIQYVSEWHAMHFSPTSLSRLIWLWALLSHNHFPIEFPKQILKYLNWNQYQMYRLRVNICQISEEEIASSFKKRLIYVVFTGASY